MVTNKTTENKPEVKPETEMLKNKVWAVIGASDDPKKFGYRTYNKLKERGYDVYPVNPVREKVCGDTCYKDIASLPQKPEVLNMVVPPEAGMEVVEEAAKMGVKNIWLQPGSQNEKLLQLIKEKGINCVQDCVLVRLG